MTGPAGTDRIRQLWARALAPDEEEPGPPRPGVPFSAAGGHSLAAARMIAAIRAELGRRISIVEMLRADPTVEELAALVAAAPPADDVAAGTASHLAGSSGPARAHQRAPLSRSMQPVWAFHRLHPGSPAYNVVRVLSIAGRVNPAALRAAALSLSDRHDALRCCVHEPHAAHPELLVQPSVTPSIGIQVVQAPSGEEPAAGPDWETTAPPAVEAALRAAADSPFDMPVAPLWRLHVVFVPQLNRTWVLLATHHLIADLRASDVLLLDLARLYGTQLAGRPVDTPPARSLVAHLLAEADTQAQPGEQTRRAADLDWWARTLGERAEARPLPLAVPADPEDDQAGAAQSLPLDTPAVEELARGLRVTNATVLLTAALAVLASWRGGGAPAVAGVPSAQAAGTEGADLVGFLVDTVPVPVAVDPGQTFADLCRHVRAIYLDALEHTSVTLGEIMARLAIPRQSSRSSLVDLWFNDLEHARHPGAFGDAAAVEYDLVPSWALFWCGLYVRRGEAGLRLHGVVPGGTMLPGDLRALLRQIRDLVSVAARQPGRAVGQLLAEPGALPPPGQLAAASPAAARVHDIAARTPDALAVHTAAGPITFAQLSADIRDRAGAWGPDCRVALGAARDYAHVVNRLAAVAAQASVVLIDRSWPAERQRAAIRIGGATDAAALDPEVLSGVQLAPRAAGTGSVIVQFTSGSAGVPLAVETASEVVAACVEDLRHWLRPRPGDRACFLSGAAHDPSWRDIELPLRAGASLFLPPEDVQANPARLVPWLRENRITLVNATPPLLSLALEPATSRLPGLRLLVVGGAPLPAALVHVIRQVAPQATVVNGYGCTETPQLLTALRLEPDDEVPVGASLPVGAPFPGRQARVRTSAGVACDVGQLGTVWARAPHIASGYLGRDSAAPPSAASRFRADPDGTRWFDTGDLARFDSAGDIQLAGRADRQRLVNGHRVVLDEIETAAQSTPGIDAAVVEVVTAGSAETLRLFVRPSPGANATEATVRESLRCQLPAAVVPARIIVTSELPMDSNLKRVPPAWSAEPAAAGSDPGPVAAPAVITLAESILGKPLDVATNFFEAGFDSVTLLHFSAELSGLLQQEIPAIVMFRYPSLRRLLPQLGVQAQAAPEHARSPAGADGGSVRDRRRQLRRSIARQLGED